MTTTTIVSGNSLTETYNGNGIILIVNGDANTIELSGQSNIVTLNGQANTLSLEGNSNNATVAGTADHLTITGNGDTISATGTNDVLTLDGTGMLLSVGDDSDISFATGAHVIISADTASAESLTEIGGANLTFNGGLATLRVGGSSNINLFNGDNQTIAIAATAQANTLTVNGQNARLTVAGGGNTVTTNGTGDTLVVTGSNNLVAVNGSNGNTVSLANYNNILDTAGTNITFAASSGATVNGGANTVAIASKDNITLTGSGGTTSLAGTGSTLADYGAYGYFYVTGGSDSVTINGDDNNVTLAGSKNTLIISGLDEQISVSGTYQKLEVNNAVIAVAAGSTLTLGNGGSTLYSSGNIVNIGSSANVLVQGSGASNNWLQIASGDTITLNGVGGGIAASGTGNRISFGDLGDVAIVSGSTLSIAGKAALDLTGTGNSVALGAQSGLTLTGSGNVITSASSKDIVSVSGSGDTLSLSGGTVSFTGSGNVTATKGTGFAVNGFAFPADTLGAYNNAAATTSLAALRATGANSVQLVITQYVATSTGTSISTSSGNGLTTESDTNLIAEIQQAKADGLSVFLAPHINIADGTWSALLKPSNISTFFTNYQAYILHYAAIAQQYGVTTFSVGNELSGVDGSKNLAAWTKLIAAVRQVYHGTITYNSAWNNTANVSFWSQLDEIGANAYVPVTNNITNPTLAQLVQGWTTVNPLDASVTDNLSAVQFYKNLAAKYNEPLLFTEAGYQSVNGTNTLSGAAAVAGPNYVDYQQQALAYQALLTVMQANEGTWFKGVYLWDWNPQSSQVLTNDFSPQGKPALADIEAWYQGTETATTGPQTGTLTGNSNNIGLGNAVTLTLSGTANTVTLGSADRIKASGSANTYGATVTQLVAGETITGTGTDTLAVSTAGTLASGVFGHITGISTIDLAAGANSVTLSDSFVAKATGGTVTVLSGDTGTTVIDASAVGATHSVNLIAAAGNATLTGGAGADTLTAGKGTDTLAGGGGADTYIYGAGDGLTTVINGTNVGVSPLGQIQFASSLTDEDLWFTQSGNDLQIDILGSKSVLTVSNWFGTNKSAAVSQIVAGGLTLTSGLPNLVSAMATYQAANPGFNPQTVTQMPSNSALHKAIVTDWHT